MNVGMLIIATGAYIRYVGTLIASMNSYMLARTTAKLHFFVFTDGKIQVSRIIRIEQPHLPWPGPTLMRYEIFAKHRARLLEMDYLYYCDADMIFMADVGKEVLGNLTGTIHPGFWNKPRARFPYENRRESTAYVPPNLGQKYYAGGFNGGRALHFLDMSDRLAKRIQTDTRNGIVARHDDESHINRYFIDHPPPVSLNPGYCYPQARWGRGIPFPRRILALDKNHAKMRG